MKKINKFLLGDNPWKTDLTTASHYCIGAISVIIAWVILCFFPPKALWIKIYVTSIVPFCVGGIIEMFDKNYDLDDVIEYCVSGFITLGIILIFLA